MTTFSPEQIRILEQTRQRLYQLTDSLNSLNRDVHNGQPLPSWTSLTSRFSILAQNLSTLSTHLSTHSTLFSNMAVFPLPEFPREQENLVVQMLRKKLEPEVEEWVERGYGAGAREGKGAAAGGDGEGMDEEAWKELWEWVMVRANEEAREYGWGVGGESSEAEEDREEDEGDGDEMDVEGQGEKEGNGGDRAGGEVQETGRTLRMEEVLRFMSTGAEPRR